MRMLHLMIPCRTPSRSCFANTIMNQSNVGFSICKLCRPSLLAGRGPIYLSSRCAMKYCPTCQQRYSGSQRYCRTDGSPLLPDPFDGELERTVTLQMPDDLPSETQEHTDALEDATLTHLEPFGEADCESELKVMGSSEYSKYYFDHTRFNREALSPKVFLIIGRRGAGKTALSQFFSFQQLMPRVTTIEVDEPEAFQQLMSKMAESAASSREVAIPRLVKIWERSEERRVGKECRRRWT